MNWNEISIGVYQDIVSTKAKGLHLLSIVTELSVKDLEKMPLSKLKDLMAKYSFLNDEPSGTLIKKWKDYSILDFKQKGGAAAMIDFMSLLEKNDYINNLHLIMATICNNGKEEDFEAKAEMFKNEMPISIAVGVSDFFLQHFSLSEKTIPYYLEQVKMNRVSPKILSQAIAKLSTRATNGIFG